MKFNIITLFPEMFETPKGVVAQAKEQGLIDVNLINPRQFTENIHQTVDDKPYGGGDGMILMADPLRKAIESIPNYKNHVVYLSPQGKLWNDEKARSWSEDYEEVTLICGRYGGVDQRIITSFVDEEISIGDFVMSGGELGAMVVVDTVSRFIPEVLGHPLSATQDTFADDLLECPMFTRPQVYMDQTVPKILLSGHHKKIEKWRELISVLRTRILREDLWEKSKRAKLLWPEAMSIAKELSEEELLACGLKKSEVLALENHGQN